jgi:hypothetical protein
MWQRLSVLVSTHYWALFGLLFLAAIASCSGSSAPASSATISYNPTISLGTWVGTWTSTTFPATDAVTATVEQDGMVLTIVFDMNGEVFASADPEEETWTARIMPGEAVLVGTVSPVYGRLEGSVSGLGNITASGANVPGLVDRFELTGTTNGTQITANVTITFDNGSTANANATLFKT